MRRILVFVLIFLPGCFSPWFETDYIPEGEDAVQWIRDHDYQVFHSPDMYNLGHVRCLPSGLTVTLQNMSDWVTAAHEWQHVQDYERMGCVGGRNEPRAYAAEWVYLGCKDEHIPYYLDGRAASWMLDPQLCSLELNDVDGSVLSVSSGIGITKSVDGTSSSGP